MMSETERRTEPLGKEGLDALADRDINKGLADYGEVLTVKERLMRRAQKKVYRFLIEDGDEEIPIDTRRMTASEREQAIIYYNKITKLKEAGDLVVINESMKAMQEILNSIVLDDELDFTSDEEWVTDEIVIGLVNLAITSSWVDSGEKIKSFRPDTDRPDNAGVVSSPRKDA